VVVFEGFSDSILINLEAVYLGYYYLRLFE